MLNDALVIAGLTLNALGVAFVGVQVLLAKRQLKHLHSTANDEIARVRKQATIEFYMSTAAQVNEWRTHLPDDWDRDAIDELVSKIYPSPGAGLPQGGNTASDQLSVRRLASYLGFFEALATAVHKGVYDLETLDAVAGSRIINISESDCSGPPSRVVIG